MLFRKSAKENVLNPSYLLYSFPLQAMDSESPAVSLGSSSSLTSLLVTPTDNSGPLVTPTVTPTL